MTNEFPVEISPYCENDVDSINKCKAISIAFYLKYYSRITNIAPFTYYFSVVNICMIIIVHNKE
jgi:hypothetical protein